MRLAQDRDAWRELWRSAASSGTSNRVRNMRIIFMMSLLTYESVPLMKIFLCLAEINKIINVLI